MTPKELKTSDNSIWPNVDLSTFCAQVFIYSSVPINSGSLSSGSDVVRLFASAKSRATRTIIVHTGSRARKNKECVHAITSLPEDSEPD